VRGRKFRPRFHSMCSLNELFGGRVADFPQGLITAVAADPHNQRGQLEDSTSRHYSVSGRTRSGRGPVWKTMILLLSVKYTAEVIVCHHCADVTHHHHHHRHHYGNRKSMLVNWARRPSSLCGTEERTDSSDPSTDFHAGWLKRRGLAQKCAFLVFFFICLPI